MENQKLDLYMTLDRLLELEKIISSEKKQFGDKDIAEYNRLLNIIENAKIEDILAYHDEVLKGYKSFSDERGQLNDKIKAYQPFLLELKQIYSKSSEEMAAKIKEINELLY